MMEKKTAIVNISKALMSVSFAVLAAIGSASGSLLFAGLSAIPVAALASSETIGSLFARTHTRDEILLDLPTPPWWAGNGTAWQAICVGIESNLAIVIQNLSQRLQNEQQVPTMQAVRQVFVDELTRQLPQWDMNAQERGLVANYVATPVMEKIAETLKAVMAPIQAESIVISSHTAAINTTEILAVLEQITMLLEKMRTETQLTSDSSKMSTGTSTNTSTPTEMSSDQILQQKLVSGIYDVFICYNEADVEGVKPIGKQLMAHGILPWFDEVDLQPGVPWMAQQEEQIQKIPSAAVCVGKSGIAPWQQMQVYAFLEQFVWRRCPVIPVILAGVSEKPSLPPFLKNMGWVNFGKQEPNPLGQLIWGITGKRPTFR